MGPQSHGLWLPSVGLSVVVTCTRIHVSSSFFVHKLIDALANDIVSRHGRPGQQALLLPTANVARRCQDFMTKLATPELAAQISVLDLVLDTSKDDVSPLLKQLAPTISAVIFPMDAFPLAKQYWQHAGEGVSSRRAEFCHDLLKSNLLVPSTAQQSSVPESPVRTLRGPRRYQRPGSIDGIVPTPAAPKPTLTSAAAPVESQESSRFLEERFGRNLDLSLVEHAKSAIRRRIAGSLTHEVDLHTALPPFSDQPSTRGVQTLTEDDVYLFPTGMNAIFTAHRALLAARGQLQSITFGFPYVDTLKILQKFGPGCRFYGHGSPEDLEDLEARLKGGERFLGLFCEFPGNPLLACPDLTRIRKLADQYDFAVVVDETIGTFANINVLQMADIVVSSLTKIFSGDSNVMGGTAVINPESKYYGILQQAMGECYEEDTYWPEDIIFMERNSRDFMKRVVRINTNAEAICDVLKAHPGVKTLYYPKYNPSRPHYDACRLTAGGYGGLLSVVFHRKPEAQAFFDAIEVAKGPSLGTNFTLCSPYVLLAHYGELDWAAEYGIHADLIRISVGLEETEEIQETFRKALRAADAAPKA